MSRKLSLALVLAAYPTVTFAQPTTLAIEPQPAPQPPPTATAVVPETAPARVAAVSNDDYDDWNAPMFVAGATAFGLSYGAVLLEAANNTSHSDNLLAVPVLGPWLALGDRDTTARILLVTDGILQAAGAVAMLDGMLQPSPSERHRLAQDKTVHVTPTVVGTQSPTAGLGVFGHF